MVKCCDTDLLDTIIQQLKFLPLLWFINQLSCKQNVQISGMVIEEAKIRVSFESKLSRMLQSL